MKVSFFNKWWAGWIGNKRLFRELKTLDLVICFSNIKKKKWMRLYYMIIFTCLWSINLLITSHQEMMKDRNQGRETDQISGANNVLYVFLYEAFYCFRSPLLCHVLQGWLLENWMCSWMHKGNCYYFLNKTICPWVSKLSCILLSSFFLLLRDNCQYG